MRRAIIGPTMALTLTIATADHALGQTPRPFPGAATTAPPAAAGPAAPPAPATSPGNPATQTAPPAPTSPPPATGAPTAATLGVPVYPAATFLSSYDAGRGQRYYLFGTTTSFAEIVAYYRTQLDDRGDLVFKDPPTHVFDVGRFREETMAFPPGVTVKDWRAGGSRGYPNPTPGTQPTHFPTIIMIVPPPPAAPATRR